jgi:hypothetical protein
MLEGVFALRVPAQRSTTTSMLPRLLLSSGERKPGASSVNYVSSAKLIYFADQLTFAKRLKRPVVREHRAILLPLFLLAHAEVHQ